MGAGDESETKASTDDKEFVSADDPAWATMTEVPGYLAALPLTPKDLQKPEVLKEQVEGLHLAADIALGALFLPEVGIAGLAGKAAEVIEGATAVGKTAEVIEGTAVAGKAVEDTVVADNAVTRIATANNEATDLAQKIYGLERTEDIRAFVRTQFSQKGPGVLETIESVLETPVENCPSIGQPVGALRPLGVRPGTMHTWHTALEQWKSVMGEHDIGKSIANLEREPEILDFVKGLAEKGKLSLYANDLKGAASRGWVRPGTKEYWYKALQAVTQ